MTLGPTWRPPSKVPYEYAPGPSARITLVLSYGPSSLPPAASSCVSLQLGCHAWLWGWTGDGGH